MATTKKNTDPVIEEAGQADLSGLTNVPAVHIIAPAEAAPQTPQNIKMLKEFRIEMPLAGRNDASMSLVFKTGQVVTDQRVIEHLKQSNALFTIQ